MQLINKRMTQKEMFELYPRQWIAYGDAEEDENGMFGDPNSLNWYYSALLIAICDSCPEAVQVPFEGPGYSVMGRGVINSVEWEEDYLEGEHFFIGPTVTVEG